MKRFLKVSSYVLAAAFFSVALSGCTKKTATNTNATSVVVWSFEDEDVWKSIKKTFENANKGITLEYAKQTFDSGYENRVLNAMLSGEGPDVWSMPNDWVYRHKEKLIPMPADIAKTTNLDEGFVPSIKESVRIGDQVYALSPSSEPLMIYYNNKLIDKTVQDYRSSKSTASDAMKQKALEIFKPIPRTWTDFASAIKLLTKKSGTDITQAGAAIGTDKITNSQDILYLLMLQRQTQILSEDLKLATFSLPSSTASGTGDTPGQKALEFYTSFANPASENYTWNDTLGSDIDAFVSGKVAMIFGYSRLQDTFAQKYPNFHDFRKAFVPQLEIQPDKIVDYARFNAFGVSVTANNPTASWALVKQLTTGSASDYNSASRVVGSGKATSYDISIDNRGSNNPETLELATAKSLVKGRYPEEFDANIRNAIRTVNKGLLSTKDALDLAANNITQLLRKTTW